ncbi:MAG: hypothetical protein JSV33_07600, partial [bacterium]
RAGGEELESDFESPAVVAIVAYLLGSASDEQERVVRAALLRSSDFRKEILELAQDVEAISTSKLPEKKRGGEGVSPDFREFIQTYGELVGYRNDEGSKWTRIRGLRILQSAAAVAVAAAAILLLILIPPFSNVHQVSMVIRDVDIDALKAQAVRRVTPTMVHETAQSAALIMIGTRIAALELEQEEFELERYVEQVKDEERYRRISLSFVDQYGEIMNDFKAYVPKYNGRVAGPINLYLLTIPSRTLYTVSVSDDSVAVMWKEGMESRGFYTITYTVAGGYSAVPAFTFSFE